MRVKILLLSLILFCCPLLCHAEEEENECNIVSVLFKGDVANGITDNISFDVICDSAEGDGLSINLLRINKFQAQETLGMGDYIITNINTYNKKYPVDDIHFTIDEADSGKAKVVTIKVGEGAKGEEINTSFNSDKGITPEPTATSTTMSDDTDKNTNTADKETVQVKETKSNNETIQMVIGYVLAVALACGLFFGYKKLKQKWNE